MTDPLAIRERIYEIEEAYEYMLAYAAQGRSEEGAGPDGAQIREFVRQFQNSLLAIKDGLEGLPKADGAAKGFIVALNRDAEAVLSVLGIILEMNNVSSEVIDNTNGLISMRSCLTNLFFLDKVVFD